MEPPSSPLRMERWERPSVDAYRALFRKIGAPWLWTSRLAMADAELAGLLGQDARMLWRVVDDSEPVGLLELDFGRANESEIAFLGLVPDYVGQGHGRWLIAETLRRAWRDGIARVWLHSCTLDAPEAPRFYRRAGFRAYRRFVEWFPDPRIAGLYPMDTAPDVPVVS